MHLFNIFDFDMEEQEKDIRWIQRLSNYKKALGQLQRFIDKGDLSELEEQGLIQAFEYTFELAWNLIKDYYTHQGVTKIQGSRDAFKIAFNRGLISRGEIWMKMVDDRIQSVHTYDEARASKISKAVFEYYHPLFLDLKSAMDSISEEGNV